VLISMKNLSDYKIEATDGGVGHVDSFLFDDQSWMIRYLVVDTAYLLPGRKVLLVPSVLGKPEGTMDAFPVDLTREQVKNSPDIDTRQSVSRQQEIELHRYYSWTPYWDAGFDPIAAPYTPVVPPMGRQVQAAQAAGEKAEEKPENPHLRSTREVAGYKIHAEDGRIGHVDDFLIDDADWTIRYLVADTRDWLPGKKVIIPPQWVNDIKWGQSEVFVKVSKETVKDSPEFDPSAPVSRDYEIRLYDYYGWPKYWL
jgi:hypothetical protein